MLEMTVCEAYRIPHSQFLGGTPEWNQTDRDKAIWWHIRQKEKCPNCGTRDSEWDPAQGGRRDAYRVQTHRCRGCEVKGMFPQAELEKMGKGVYVYLGKNDAQ